MLCPKPKNFCTFDDCYTVNGSNVTPRHVPKQISDTKNASSYVRIRNQVEPAQGGALPHASQIVTAMHTAVGFSRYACAPAVSLEVQFVVFLALDEELDAVPMVVDLRRAQTETLEINF